MIELSEAVMIFAQSSTDTGVDWVDLAMRLGFPTVVVVCLIKGWLVPGFIYDRTVRENERLTAQTEEKIIPLTLEGQRVLTEALELLREKNRRESSGG